MSTEYDDIMLLDVITVTLYDLYKVQFVVGAAKCGVI